MKRSTIILAALFLVLLALFYISSQDEGRRGAQVERLLTVDWNDIERIEVFQPEERIALERRRDQWFLTDPLEYPADQGYVETLLRNASDLKIDGMVSDKPEKHGLFQVDSTGTEVRLSSSHQRLATFVVGKTSNDYSHTYVRRSDGEEIYLIKGLIGGHYTRRVRDWRDKTIFTFPEASIQKVRLIRSESSVELWKEGANWKAQSDGETFSPDEDQVDRLVDALSGLRTYDFRGQEEEGLDFSKPDFRVEMVLHSGEQKALSLLPEDENRGRYFAKRGEDETVFILRREALSNILKGAEDLRAE